MAGLLILLFFAVIAIAPHVFVGPLETATTATAEPFDSPSSAHLFGTDELGRDMLNRTVHGARISMLIGLLATLVTVFLGVFVGIIAGFVGGLLDSILMRIADFFLVLPTFVLALILAPVLIRDRGGPGIVLRHPGDAARHRDRDRVDQLGDDGPGHPLAGPVAEGADVRRPGPGHRCRAGLDHALPHPPERRQPDRGSRRS